MCKVYQGDIVHYDDELDIVYFDYECDKAFLGLARKYHDASRGMLNYFPYDELDLTVAIDQVQQDLTELGFKFVKSTKTTHGVQYTDFEFSDESSIVVYESYDTEFNESRFMVIRNYQHESDLP